VSADLDDLVVIISTGEVSTWGSGRTRREAELGMSGGEDGALTAAGVLELAWGMGLLTWQDSPKAGWAEPAGETAPAPPPALKSVGVREVLAGPSARRRPWLAESARFLEAKDPRPASVVLRELVWE